MEAADSLHNVFSSHDLWKQPSFFDDGESEESTLFPPLQLDSEPSRVSHKHVNASC